MNRKFLMTFCKASQQKLPDVNLLDYCRVIEKELLQIETTIQTCIDTISKAPFLAIFDIWIKKYGYAHAALLDASKALLEHNFIKIYDTDGTIWTIGKTKEFDHRQILDDIRSESKWSIRRKETLVQTYISFMSWLWNESRGYVSKLDDPDQLQTIKRTFKFSHFIEFLDAVTNEKSQLVAKLLYFGNKRTLEEVLSLKLEQVDFTKKLIHYDSDPIHYPAHVFNDIRAITSPRKTGHIFEGRQTATINPKTVFRNFQEAAERAGLETPFSIKSLTINE